MSLHYAPWEQPILRAPRQNERLNLAELIILAGDPPPGFPSTMRKGRTPIDLAARRMSMRWEAFCRKYALVCDIEGRVAGMMLGYRLACEGDTPKLAGLCPSLRPLSGLEDRRPASFYINTLAVYPRHQDNGLGAFLLSGAEKKARKAHCTCLLLEVSAQNAVALRFYARHGFMAWEGRGEALPSAGTIVVLEKPLSRPDSTG